MLLVVVPSAIVGARLFSVLDNYGYYSHHLLDVVKPPYIGLAIYGNPPATARSADHGTQRRSTTTEPVSSRVRQRSVALSDTPDTNTNALSQR